jgi:hypothetical protein
MKQVRVIPVTAVYVRGNKEVAKLMGLPHLDMVTNLIKNDKLKPVPRGKGRAFKVSHCLEVADMIDRGIITVSR